MKWKILVRIFLLVFLAFAAAGFYEKNRDLQAPDAIDSQALANVSLVRPGKDIQTFHLEYSCDGRWLVKYDVDKNEYFSRLDKPDSDFLHFIISKDSILVNPILVSYFHGRTTPLTLKQFIDFIKSGSSLKDKISLVSSAIVGEFSGYAIGYWLGTFTKPACNGKRMIEFVRNLGNWKTLSKQLYESYLFNYEAQMMKFSSEYTVQEKEEIRKRMKEQQKSDFQVRSGDLQWVSTFSNKMEGKGKQQS